MYVYLYIVCLNAAICYWLRETLLKIISVSRTMRMVISCRQEEVPFMAKLVLTWSFVVRWVEVAMETVGALWGKAVTYVRMHKHTYVRTYIQINKSINNNKHNYSFPWKIIRLHRTYVQSTCFTGVLTISTGLHSVLSLKRMKCTHWLGVCINQECALTRSVH